MHTHSFKPLAGFLFRVKVRYHPTHRSLLKKFNGSVPLKETETLCAFVTPINPRKREWRLATMHFSEPNFTPEWVSHEAAHVVNWMVRCSGLDLRHHGSEELTAMATGNIVREILDHAPKKWKNRK